MSAPTETVFAVYAKELLVFAFADGAGVVLPAGTGLPPVARHPAIHGRLLVAGIEHELLALIGGSTSCADVQARCVEGGLDVRPTPRSAMRWALG